jgi:hypothetical protein
MAREMHVSERSPEKQVWEFIAIRKYICENWGLTLSLPNFCRSMGKLSPQSSSMRLDDVFAIQSLVLCRFQFLTFAYGFYSSLTSFFLVS